jgi:hypothetical protein
MDGKMFSFCKIDQKTQMVVKRLGVRENDKRSGSQLTKITAHQN